MIGVLSYGVGNPLAVVRMCDSVGVDAELVSVSHRLHEYQRLIIPGVGHFDACVNALRTKGFFSTINDYHTRSLGPILGICVGAQVLGRSSEEGVEKGLSLLPMSTRRMLSDDHEIPHMGWSETVWVDSSAFTPQGSVRYYYSHSYEMNPDRREHVAGVFEYDGLRVGAVCAGQVMAVQFHPEKSHRFGKSLFEWFSGWNA